MAHPHSRKRRMVKTNYEVYFKLEIRQEIDPQFQDCTRLYKIREASSASARIQATKTRRCIATGFMFSDHFAAIVIDWMSSKVVGVLVCCTWFEDKSS